MRHFRIKFQEKRIPLFTETTDKALSHYFSDYKVPVLVDGNVMVWDSLSILEYMSERYLDSQGWPANVKARAFARSVSAEMHSSFANLRNELPMNCRKKFSNITLSNDTQREIERVKQIWRTCRVEFAADGDWLFGDFSVADAMYAPVALRLEGYGIPLAEIEASYVQRVLSHPGIVEWIESGKQEKEVIEMNEIEF
jgi:glutathione S-transferase